MSRSALRQYQRYFLYTLVLLLPLIITPTGRDIFRLGKEVCAQAITLAIVSLAAVEWISEKRTPSVPTIFLLPLLALCGWSGLTVFWSQVPPLALYALFNLVLFSLFAVALVRLLEPRVLRHLILLNLIPASFTGIYTVIQYFGLDPVLITPQGTPLSGRLNAGGLVGDVNTAGCYLAISLAISVNSIFLEKSAFRRAAVLSGCSASLIGLLFTQTLTAIAAAATALLILALLDSPLLFSVSRGKKKIVLVLVCLLILAGASGVAFTLKNPQFRERIATRYHDFQNGNWAKLTSYRAPMFAVTWHLARERPLIGHSLNSFETDFYAAKLRYRAGQQISMPGSIESTPRQAHNEYLQVWAELGIIGLISLLATLGSVLYVGFRGIVSSQDFEVRCLLIAALSAFAVVIISSLSFFPAHLALTAVWVVIPASGVVSMGNLARQTSGAASRENIEDRHRPRNVKETLHGVAPAEFVAALAFTLVGGYFLLSPLVANERISEATALIERVISGGDADVEGLLQRSLELLDFARRKDPLDPQIYQSAGTAHWFLSEFEEALKDFSYAALLDPTPEAFTNLGETYRAMGNLDLAEKSFTTALAYNPEFEKAKNARALVEKMRGNKRPAN
ncbi:MAG TPA: O-antigen ligase family protein [Acidobacteriota bacterium]|jgi:O-antigen ligase